MKKIAVSSENISNVNTARTKLGLCTSQVFLFSFLPFRFADQSGKDQSGRKADLKFVPCKKRKCFCRAKKEDRFSRSALLPSALIRKTEKIKAEKQESKPDATPFTEGDKVLPIFFNQIFDKKRLKALISWVFKQSGEAEALRVIDLLKETGFRHATKAGISIGLHDLATPFQKSVLISESKLAIATTERNFSGAKITATERSQRIIDTWHRASESLSKQVVDYFATYDRFNPVYIMALSGARGNFSQVRQLIGMRGLMADQQGKIVNFPIQSNLREGLTLTEYFISCSGARKGLVDTALRTADTGYLTRRLVDVSHHVVVKKLRCNTNRSLAFRSLQSYNKVLLPLKERLVGRVLSEDIFSSRDLSPTSTSRFCMSGMEHAKLPLASSKITERLQKKESTHMRARARTNLPFETPSSLRKEVRKHTYIVKPSQTDKISPLNERALAFSKFKSLEENKVEDHLVEKSPAYRTVIAKQDQEISLKLASKIAKVREKVYLRSPLTCGFTHSVCQLCYGWSISQGTLVSLGDAVGVIAAQSIGEPGTQLTMRTFHTGGVFSGDLLQEIRAPHAGKIVFSKAFGGLLIRTAHGDLAFLSKSEGSLYLSNDESLSNPRKTVISIPAFSLLFIRQGEKVSNNQLLAEFSTRTKEGAQPIKSQQTIFAQLSGVIVEECSGRVYTKKIKESALLLDSLHSQNLSPQNTYLDFPKIASAAFSHDLPIPFEAKFKEERSEIVKDRFQKKKEISSFCEGKPVSSLVDPLTTTNGWFEKPSSLEICKSLQMVANGWSEKPGLLKPCKSDAFGISNLEFGLQNEVLYAKKELKRSQKGAKSPSVFPKNCQKFARRFGLATKCKAQIYRNENIEDDLFSYLEPVQSGRLGFLKIISTRIGATLDYSYPIKSIDHPFVKKNKIHDLTKDRYCTNLNLTNSKSFRLYWSSYKAYTCAYKSFYKASYVPNKYKKICTMGHTKRAHKKLWFLATPKKKPGSLEPSFVSTSGIKNTNQKFVRRFVRAYTCSCNLRDKRDTPVQFCFSKAQSKYLHPESIKENRFLLQTIAEYGDIVDETYKNKK